MPCRLTRKSKEMDALVVLNDVWTVIVLLARSSFPLSNSFNVVLTSRLSWRKMSFLQVSQDSHFPLQNLPYGVFSTSVNVSTLNGVFLIMESIFSWSVAMHIFLYLLAKASHWSCNRRTCVRFVWNFWIFHWSRYVPKESSSSRGKISFLTREKIKHKHSLND